MDVYINDKKKLYTAIHEFFDNSEQNSAEDDQYFQNLTKIFQDQEIENNSEEIGEFIRIIQNFSDYYHRDINFFKKFKRILQHYQYQIKQSLSNEEIFKIFENNKHIVYFLLKSGIITISDQIYKEMIDKVELNGERYCHFFYPELEYFIGEETMKGYKDELLEKDSNFFGDFDEKRKEGENDSYICSLIRQDSVKEFVQYVNRNSYSLSSRITPSIFETNIFLIEHKNTTLIEYAAFFGSIQIFQYLMMNNVEMTSSLWLYSIHSNNAELIHLLERSDIPPPKIEKKEENVSFIRCFIESIKCHHNDLAKYIEENLLTSNDSKEFEEEILSNYIKYHNYSFLKIDGIIKFGFFYLCFYNYHKAVELLLNKKENEIKTKIIYEIKLFNAKMILPITLQ